MNGNNTLCKCHEKSPPTPLIEKSSQREAQTPRWPREVWQNAGMKQWQAIDSHTKTCSTKDQWAIHNDAWHLHGLGLRDSVDALTFDVVTANNESKSSGTLNVSVLFGGYVIHWLSGGFFATGKITCQTSRIAIDVWCSWWNYGDLAVLINQWHPMTIADHSQIWTRIVSHTIWNPTSWIWIKTKQC